MANWSAAQPDILVEISKRIDSIEDYASFRGVCTSWRSAATKENFNQSPTTKLPWLMLDPPNLGSAGSGTNVRLFLSLYKAKVVHQTIIPQPQPWPRKSFECRGWLFIVEPGSGGVGPPRIYLSHPLSGVNFDIPNRLVYHNCDGFYFDHIHQFGTSKVVLSTHSPTNPNFAIFIAHNHKLCMWRKGAETWTVLGQSFKKCSDIAYNNEQLYVADSVEGTVSRFKIEGSRLIVSKVVAYEKPMKCDGNGISLTLVEPTSNDSILVIFHEMDKRIWSWSIKKMYVFEADFRRGMFKEVKSLGDRAIFSGLEPHGICHRNGSILVKGCGVRGIKGNCIYFTCKSFYLPYENTGVSDIDLYRYNLEDGSFHACMSGLFSRSSGSRGIPMEIGEVTFITPTFW